ncbi:MAG: ABC-2 type transport system permease protein, partial [Lysobacterales bacterium]
MMIVNPVGVASLARREINRFAVDAARTIFPPLITSTIFLLIFGVTIGSRVDITVEGLSYLQFIVPGIMTLHLISTSYENTSASLFIGLWQNHIQEVLLYPLSY